MSTKKLYSPLRQAAQAVLGRWDSLKWERETPGLTADLMMALLQALEAQQNINKNVGVMGYAMMRNGKQVGIERSYDAAISWIDAEIVPLYAAPTTLKDQT